MIKVSASLVIYHNKKEQIKKAIYSFINTDVKVKLYLIDNSSNDNLKELMDIDSSIEYIFNGANLGYGKAHNIALKKSISAGIQYHLILNPDISFNPEIIKKIINYLDNNNDVGLLMPKVLNIDGSIQYLAKLLPSPIDLIFRRFLSFNKWFIKRNNIYELRFSGYDKIMTIPNLSGCFMFLRISILLETGLFDERYFMFLEDHDFSRRIHKKHKTIYYPEVEITHEHAKGSYKFNKLFLYHIVSAIRYFNKWGWFFDNSRKEINKKTLQELGYKK